jgi:type IV secretion system protein VirD4
MWLGRHQAPVLAWLGPRMYPVFMIAGVIFIAPGVYALLLPARLLGLGWVFDNMGSWSDWVVTPLTLFTLFLSWIFWSILVSRSLKVAGLWNPFRADWKHRPRMLKAIVVVREWWEIITRFGRGVTSGWAGLIEVLSCRYRDGDVFLGRPMLFVRRMLRPIGLPTETHMVTIAETGAGKSTAALIRNLCLHNGSLLCIDPKGELAAITAGRRNGATGIGVRGLGQRVHVVDPFRIVKNWYGNTSSYNVFDEIERVASTDPDAVVGYAGKIAEGLAKQTSQRDPYFDLASQTFLTGLVPYVYVVEAKENGNLVRLRQLVVSGAVDLYKQGVEEGAIDPDDRDFTAFDLLLLNMQRQADGPYGDVIAGAADTILKMGPNQMGSVVTTAQEHTSFLDIPEIRRISMKSDFLLEDLKTGNTSIYICVPLLAVTGREGRWLRMFVLLTIDMMKRRAEAGKRPLLLAIDEFPSLGHLEGMEDAASTLRSYGVRLWVIGQNITQFEAAYPKLWESFIGGAEAVQFMGIKHPSTVDYLMKRLGAHVVMENRREGRERRRIVLDKPLLDANTGRLLSKERKNQIIWRGNKRPMLLKTTPYFEYMPWWYYEPDPRYAEKLNRRLWRLPFRIW